MKPFVRILLTLPFIGGAGACGYFIAKKKYEVLADKEVESVRKALTKYYEDKNPQPKEQPKPEKTKSTEKKEPEVKITNSTSIVNNQTTEEAYVDYSKQYRSASVEQKVEASKEASKKKARKDPAPYIIDSDMYERSEYNARTLYFYSKEGILTDYDGKQIDNAADLIGDVAIKTLTAKDVDYIYVRNEKLEVDFEIILNDKSFFNASSNERVIPEDY